MLEIFSDRSHTSKVLRMFECDFGSKNRLAGRDVVAALCYVGVGVVALCAAAALTVCTEGAVAASTPQCKACCEVYECHATLRAMQREDILGNAVLVLDHLYRKIQRSTCTIGKAVAAPHLIIPQVHEW